MLIKYWTAFACSSAAYMFVLATCSMKALKSNLPFNCHRLVWFYLQDRCTSRSLSGQGPFYFPRLQVFRLWIESHSFWTRRSSYTLPKADGILLILDLSPSRSASGVCKFQSRLSPSVWIWITRCCWTSLNLQMLLGLSCAKCKDSSRTDRRPCHWGDSLCGCIL